MNIEALYQFGKFDFKKISAWTASINTLINSAKQN